jgi:TRAP transporter TAXI family solute receptor
VNKKAILYCAIMVLIAFVIIGCTPQESNGEGEANGDHPYPLPKNIVITSYGLESGGYAAMSAMTEYFRQAEGVNSRIIPSGTDLGRLGPVVQGKADFALGALSAYLYCLGMFETATPEWGPQNLRMVAMAPSETGSAFITKDPGNIKTVKDLKGKRVGRDIGSATIALHIEGTLALEGLTYDDVIVVDYPSTNDMHRGFMAGEIDATYINTSASSAREIEASRWGLHYIEMPPPGDERWELARKVHPFAFGGYLTAGAGCSKENPVTGWGSVYPLFYCDANLDIGKAYHMTRMILEHNDGYRDQSSLLEPLTLDNQDLFMEGCFPWHEGSIEYFKEKGIWTEEHEAANQKKIEQLNDVAALWEEALLEAEENKLSGDKFLEFWHSKVMDFIQQ